MAAGVLEPESFAPCTSISGVLLSLWWLTLSEGVHKCMYMSNTPQHSVLRDYTRWTAHDLGRCNLPLGLVIGWVVGLPAAGEIGDSSYSCCWFN